MSRDFCPICYTPLEQRDVAPCWDCGDLPSEIEHALEGQHTYSEMRLFGFNVVLCNFCQSDFGSYDPRYLGLNRREQLNKHLKLMTYVRSVDVFIGKDKYCPECQRRLAWLEFLVKVRELNSPDKNIQE